MTILGDTPDRQWKLVDANGNEMPYTYASPGSAEFYRNNKRFAGGTVLVKEVFATTHAHVRLLGCSGGTATDAFNKDVPEQLAG